MPEPGLIRVLQLATAGPLYGAERWVLALARGFDPARVDCHVGVIDDLGGEEPPLLAAAREQGFACHRIPFRGRFDPAAVGALRGRLIEGRFDVVHAHGYKADLLALAAARGTDVRTVATPHGWSEKVDWKLRLYEWADRLSFRWFDAVAPLSPDLRDGLLRDVKLASVMHYIPNGVDLEEIDAARNVPRDAGTGPVIGYCGQLIARKDVATLLRAFALVDLPDARLLLVGEGDERAALEEQATRLGVADRTQFAGYRSDRLDWMARFDLFVLPSLREGIPRCLMEAMALGVPVIASDIAGNRDLVTRGETGHLFATGDAQRLAERIKATLTDPDRAAMVERARARIEQRHSGRAMAQAYEALFRKLL